MTAHDHARRLVAFESTHRTESGFEPTVLAFDTIVRMLFRIVKRSRDQYFDRSPQRRVPIGHDLDRLTMRAQCLGEEPARCSEVPSWRGEHIDELTELINGPVDVTPPSGDLHVRLVHEPTVTHRMPARHRRIRKQRSEPLHPPVDGDVVDLDATLGE